MATVPETEHGQVHDLTPEEAREVFNGMARAYLNMSGDEFLRRWDAGEWKDNPDQPGVIQLALMLPLGRPHAP